jgi:hypothetical protein
MLNACKRKKCNDLQKNIAYLYMTIKGTEDAEYAYQTYINFYTYETKSTKDEDPC